MLESTLFGYEKGAFTGAVQACPGKFEQAQGGTILLDEITEMDLSLQSKLLRVLQEKEVERLGSRKTIELDVRVIATSNRDLKVAVAEGKFREDLYYRLNVFPLRWLPLKERALDIVPIAEFLLSKIAKEQKIQVKTLSESAKKKLLGYSWPGNVRELDNVMQRAVIIAGDVVTENDIIIDDASYHFDSLVLDSDKSKEIEAIAAPLDYTFLSNDEEDNSESKAPSLGKELKQQEFQIILDTLKEFNGSRQAVAEKLQISPRTLRYKIAKMREEGYEIP